VPIVENIANAFNVTVGNAAHPMEDKHLIEWIEVIDNSKAYQSFLDPGDTTEAFFEIKADKITAQEYCNLHSLWKVY